MSISELDRRMHKLLSFCVKHSDLTGSFIVDEKGLFLKSDSEDQRSVPISRFPFSLEQCRHYFIQLENVGYIQSEDGWMPSFTMEYDITDAGHAFLSEFGWWKRQFEALRDNVVTIFFSVVAALLIGWAVSIWGPTP